MNEYGVRAKNQWISVANEDDVDVNGNEVDTLWYYFGDNGKAYKADSNELKKKAVPDSTGTRTYFFDSEGHMVSGWVVNYKDGDKDKTYYCGTENEGWAYTGWQYLEPSDDLDSEDYDDLEWYHFKSSGEMRHNSTWYNKGRYYTFDSKGVMESDWYGLEVASNANGVATGTGAAYEGKNAYTSESGSKGTGWVYTENAEESDSYWYYLVSFKDKNGTVRNLPFNSQAGDSYMRAKVIKGKTYIFDKDGTMQDGRVILTNLNNNGISDYKGGAVSKAMTNGTYYFNENSGSVNGQMVTGKTTVTKDGEDFYYYFDKTTGRAVTDVVKDGIIYGHDGERIDAEDGNTNAIVTLDYPVAYSKSEVDVVIDGKTVKGIPASTDHEIIVSATGKLRTSGTVKVDGVRYKIHSEDWTLERLDD